MGGPGSGNRFRYGKKDTVEMCRELDVRDWSRKGYLRDIPVDLTITWSKGTEQIASIGASVSRYGTRLFYTYWIGADESNEQSRNYIVPITWTTCNFGGERPWFICPGVTRAGLPEIRFHDLRHTCATLLLGRGVHPKLVQELLGHATISMTLDIYSHYLPSMGDAAAGAMGDALG